jgi:hypothetical protein
MFSQRLFVGVSLLIVAGCGKGAEERNLELEQQKLTLQLMQSQREQLASLAEREKAALAIEKKNSETLKQIENRQSNLDATSKDMDERQARLKIDLAKATDAIKAKEAKLAVREAELRALQDESRGAMQRIAAKDQEVNARIAGLQAQAAAEARRAAEEAAAREERQRPEVVNRLKRREPELIRLVDLTTDVAIDRNSYLVRSTFRKGLSDAFNDAKWGKISDEDEFSHEAVTAALSYVSSKISDTSFKVDTALYTEPMHKWRLDYMRANQQAEKR